MGSMASIGDWIVRMANQSVGKATGIYVDQAWEVLLPLIVIGGIIIAWIAFRPKATRY